MPDAPTLVVLLLAATLLAVAAAARLLLQREWVHPGVVFPLHWGVMLMLVVAAAGLGFYPVAPQAAALFVFGALCFVGGALCGDGAARLSARSRAGSGADADPIQRIAFRRIAWASVLLHAVMIVPWWTETLAVADGATDLLQVGFQVRYRTVFGDAAYGSFVGNYLVLGLIIVPVLVIGAIRGRVSAWLVTAAALPWVGTNLISNGRSGLVTLTLGLVYLRLTAAKPLNLRAVLTGFLLFLLVFGGGVLLVAKGNASVDDSLGDIGLAVVTNLSDYLLQGPVLFSRYFTNEVHVQSTWDPFVFGCSLLQHAGLCKMGELHQDFIEFADGRIGNVYTVFFSVYPTYGWIGVLAIVGGYGAWASFHHRRHRQGGSLGHTLWAAYLFAAVPLSTFFDGFGPTLNFLIKAAIVCALIQRFVVERRGPRRRADPGPRGAEHALPLGSVRP